MIVGVLWVGHNFDDLLFFILIKINCIRCDRLIILRNFVFVMVLGRRFQIFSVVFVYIPGAQRLQLLEIMVHHILYLQLFSKWHFSDLSKILAAFMHWCLAKNVNIWQLGVFCNFRKFYFDFGWLFIYFFNVFGHVNSLEVDQVVQARNVGLFLSNARIVLLGLIMNPFCLKIEKPISLRTTWGRSINLLWRQHILGEQGIGGHTHLLWG